jgi:hypothetical protein
MRTIRSGFITATLAIPFAFGCERSDPAPVGEPGSTTRTVTGEEAERREGTRGTIGTDDETTQARPQAPPPSEAPGTLGAPSAASAIDQITQARCARENRCDNVGADKKYSSMEECMTEIRREWQDDLDARSCPGGIAQAELSECLSDIRNDDCGNPFDTLGRMMSCRESQICRPLGTR